MPLFLTGIFPCCFRFTGNRLRSLLLNIFQTLCLLKWVKLSYFRSLSQHENTFFNGIEF